MKNKVKKEIMKNFKSIRYAKHDRMKGYKTGAPEPSRESTQESRAIGGVIGKLELSRMFDLCELSRHFHVDR